MQKNKDIRLQLLTMNSKQPQEELLVSAILNW